MAFLLRIALKVYLTLENNKYFTRKRRTITLLNLKVFDISNSESEQLVPVSQKCDLFEESGTKDNKSERIKYSKIRILLIL